jgi:hypothetical protein
MPGSRNRHDVISLREHPGERELRGGALVLLRDLFHPRDQLEILVEVLTLKSRVLSPEIVGGEIIDALDLSGEESAAERAVRDEPDVEEA